MGTITSSASARKDQFRPRRFLGGGHVQTIASFLLPRRITVPKSEEQLIEVEPGIHVLCHCHWQADRRSALTVIVVHGLEGSTESHYMLGIAEKGLAGVSLQDIAKTAGVDDAEIAKLFGSEIVSAVKKSSATRWNAAPFALGAMSAAVPGGQPSRKVLTEPIGCMFLAGEATHETLWGTVDGAWESGERAAEAALRKIGALKDTEPAAPAAPAVKRRHRGASIN